MESDNFGVQQGLTPETEPDPLETILIHGRPLPEWHKWLTTDQRTGQYHGYDQVPASRYGRDGEECAYWALACELIYCEANGENSDENPKEALDYCMGLVVNDHDDVLSLVRNYWYAVPEALKPYLDYEDNGLTMAQQARLSSLCDGYHVEYNAEHYGPQFDLPPGYVAGWVGGLEHKAGTEHPTIYVGVSEDGESSS